ncbi:MAG: cell envelope integrity EipB family protein [Hyphomicrobium sp.]
MADGEMAGETFEHRRWATAIAILAVSSSFNSAAFGDSPVAFTPHRAVYEFVLAKSAPGSGVVDMSGRMVYELSGSACEGYTQNMRFVTRTSNQEGVETLNDLRNSSWEDASGKRLRFSTNQYQNDEMVDQSQGDASRRAEGTAAIDLDLVRPVKKRAELPGEISFPMQHASQLIQAARAGKTLLMATLYDGSEKGEKYYTTTAIIGRKIEPVPVKNSASLKGQETIAGVASWPVSISYFEIGRDKQDTPPSYELSFRYYENGVTNDLKIDYGEFALKGEIKELQSMPASACNGKASR